MVLQKYMKIFVLVFAFSSVLVTLGNGCSQPLSNIAGQLDNNKSQSTSSSDELVIDTGPTDIEVIADTQTVSVVNSKQVVDQLSSCVGVPMVSEKTLAMYEQKKGAISITGSANTITAPMTMAIASIAGEVCNDLIDREVQSARFFGWNLAASTMPTASDMASTISKLSVSCWQRNESQGEVQLLTDLVQSSVSASENMAGRKSALLLCTSMLSSLDAILY